MNRPIKFRAWDGESEMVYFDLRDTLLTDWELKMPKNRAKMTVMQFTGFGDARMDNIFESDILEIDSVWYTVVWCDYAGLWLAQGMHGAEDIHLAELVGNELFIQGNIYEHSYLLTPNQ